MDGRPQAEVAYYTPCAKKLKQYPDVMKVPRPQRCHLVYVRDTEANVLWQTDEQFVTVGIIVGGVVHDVLGKCVFHCSSTLLKHMLVYQDLLCANLCYRSSYTPPPPPPPPCFLWP